ncbi:MAG: FAD-dependent oxidoreductase [Bryobacterales bacterium]|nr:FAD-dependent oxidoreductase [Bryobacterales bacterium]
MSTTETPTTYEVKLKGRLEVAAGTLAFQFEKPAGFTFKAGQYVELSLIDPPETDAEGNARAFSIASAPHEDFLTVATRMRDTAFKRVLSKMKQGAAARIEGPFGNLVLHNNPARSAVLLAGGIGITPFRSMALRAANERLPHRIFLFCSNRTPEDAPFLEELRRLEALNPNYRFSGTITQPEKARSPWQGETGFLTAGMLSRFLKEAVTPVYYLAGPPGMVAAVRTVLANLGVDDDDIRTEEFAGY